VESPRCERHSTFQIPDYVMLPHDPELEQLYNFYHFLLMHRPVSQGPTAHHAVPLHPALRTAQRVHRVYR
jgi:hypothetical protein